MDNFVIWLFLSIVAFLRRHKKGAWALVMLVGLLIVFSAAGRYEHGTIEFGELAACSVIGVSLFALGGFAGGLMR